MYTRPRFHSKPPEPGINLQDLQVCPKTKQRYFCHNWQKGTLYPYFIFLIENFKSNSQKNPHTTNQNFMWPVVRWVLPPSSSSDGLQWLAGPLSILSNSIVKPLCWWGYNKTFFLLCYYFLCVSFFCLFCFVFGLGATSSSGVTPGSGLRNYSSFLLSLL